MPDGVNRVRRLHLTAEWHIALCWLNSFIKLLQTSTTDNDFQYFVCQVQCTALDTYKITWVYVCQGVSVCMCVCPKNLSSTIASAVFVRSLSNLEHRSHTWQRRPSSMANNTKSGKCACASVYFRFRSLARLRSFLRHNLRIRECDTRINCQL